jgi:hypothetical protein
VAHLALTGFDPPSPMPRWPMRSRVRNALPRRPCSETFPQVRS